MQLLARDLCSSDDQKLEGSIRKGSLHTCPTSHTLRLRLFRGDKASVKANTPSTIQLEEMKTSFSMGLLPSMHITFTLKLQG